MTEKHTPGRLHIGTAPPNGEQTIGTHAGLMVAVATAGADVPTQANAARLVACWNACEGISTEALESEGHAVLGWTRTASKLIQATTQRDKLLEALRSCLSQLECHETDAVNGEPQCMQDARAAIAEVTGGNT